MVSLEAMGFEEWTPALGAARVLRRCDELATCSDEPGRLTRTFLSPALAKAHAMAGAWMREAGLTPRVDAMGNLIGHRAGVSDAPVWMLGSHLDTVPNAGKYDGMLGVLLAIEVVASLSGKLPFAIEVAGFSDEEGVRFKTPYLGSRAVAGSFNPQYQTLRDAEGISLRQAMTDFGLDPNAWPSARYEIGRVRGYLEAHIEQGPVLETLGAPLGIVSAIAGQSRLRFKFRGRAGHAGTLPMGQRHDALTCASEWVLSVEDLGAKTPGLLATVGWLEAGPNVANVVPGETQCSLDVRHSNDAARERAVTLLQESAQSIARRRGVQVEVVAHVSQPAVPMDAGLRRQLHEVVGRDAPEIVSGAGHDAAMINSIAPCAMLFLRTPGGASHCPEEAVESGDVALALQAMRGFLLKDTG